MSKQDKGTGKVHQLHADKVTKINPPKTWVLKLTIDHGRSQATYFQKADANTPLVRIVDVLADFADRHGLPAGAAVDDFLTAVDSTLLDAVYTLHENHFATLVDAGFMYGLDTQAEAEAQSIRLHGVKDASRGLYPWAASPLEAFKRHIQDHGPQRSDRSLYAVSHATANRMWDWGAVVAAQAETQAAPAMEAPKADSGKKGRYDWEGDPALYEKLVTDYGKAKGSEKAKRETVANDWGLSPASIKKQLPIAKAAVEAAAKSPFNPVAVGCLTERSSQ